MQGRQQARNRVGRGTWSRKAAATVSLVAIGVLLSLPLPAQTPGLRQSGAILSVKGEINDILKDSVQRRVDQARAAGASVIVFELNTPGGIVTSALEICQIIKSLPADIRTVAWVRPKAYSAGAMISVACNEIWMSSSAAIGDCAPIMVTPTGGVEELGQTERAKAESPILQEFRESASRNGYDHLLSRAMVAVGEEVWWLESIDDPARRRFVSGAEKKKLIDEVPEAQRQWKPVETITLVTTGKAVPLPQPVDRADTLLTLGQDEAVAFGFARGVARDTRELAQKLELTGPPLYLHASGWEKFAAWLNSPLVRGILFMIVIVGAYMEFQHPGMILPGVTAAIALVIFLAAPYAAGLANIWTFILLAIGLVLLALELFVIPGFGISGILGIALVLVAVLGTFVPQEPAPDPTKAPWFSWPSLPGTWKALERGVLVMSSSIGIAITGIVLILRYLPRLSVSRGVVSPNPEAGAMALSDLTGARVQPGDIGVVTGDLRPGGQARFGPEIVDVQSQGHYVEAGRRVQVLRREGMRIVVQPLPDETETET